MGRTNTHPTDYVRQFDPPATDKDQALTACRRLLLVLGTEAYTAWVESLDEDEPWESIRDKAKSAARIR